MKEEMTTVTLFSLRCRVKQKV